MTLGAAAIVTRLAPATRARLRDVDAVREIDSTNAELARRGVPNIALIADTQTAGRGRRGKSWASPPGANLYLSLAWPLRQAAGLSLAMGVACAEALREPRVRVKWPNDLVVDGRKLGGLLIEIAGPLAVIGVGVNLRMPPAAAQAIDQPWIDLASLGRTPDRATVAAQVLDAMVAALLDFERAGLAAFATRWEALDALRGRDVRVVEGERVHAGRADGIAPDGALRVVIDGETRHFHSAEVSVRALPADAEIAP